VNLGPISQSLILAGESAEVDVLARRAVPVPADTIARDPNAAASTSRDVALQFTSVGNNDTDYADLSRNAFLSSQPRSPLDLYRRVQRTNSSKGSRQLVDVFA
jgi:hypothetical protein